MDDVKKRGRPSSETSKKTYIGIRLDESERALLEQIASNKGISASEVMRKALKQYSTTYRFLD